LTLSLTDKGGKRTQVDPSRPGGSAVYFAIGALLKLRGSVYHIREFGLQVILYIVAARVALSLIEFVSSPFDLLVQRNIYLVI
jgi:hypothetical protein